MSTPYKVGLILDPIEQLHLYKDSSMAMYESMAERGWHTDYIEQSTLGIDQGVPYAQAQSLALHNDGKSCRLGETNRVQLTDYQLLLMRQDPPCDKNFMFNTMVLQLAEARGVLVANHCQPILTLNEKLFATHFPELTPPTLVSRNMSELDSWYRQHTDVVIKPLDGMGGKGIFHIKPNDDNASSIFETVTQSGTELAMLQQYIPEIIEGDKRILLIDGTPFEYALARIPKANEARANLATGGRGEARLLTERDWHIANTIGKAIQGMGLYFVGIDVIGDYLTEINITSPTGVKELQRDTGLNLLEPLFECLESIMQSKQSQLRG